MFNRELYIPRIAVIKDVGKLTHDIKLFKVAFKDRRSEGTEGLGQEHQYEPGQFVQLSILGEGEAPISISSSPTQKDYLEFCVKEVGAVTGSLHRLGGQDWVGVRGPYGNGWPMDGVSGKSVLCIAGGIGIAPIRSLINELLSRKGFAQLTILYGARSPEDLVFRKELAKWSKVEKVKVMQTVDLPDKRWKGNVGVVSRLLTKIEVSPEATLAYVCGPPLMIKFVVIDLLKMGFVGKNIFLSLERYMKCGVGKCGHCYIGTKYVCTDGPIFSCQQLKESNINL